ncbi:MAG TPA: hypothetical protein VJ832_06970, partial [Variovorax sp.]|nr:hypothetical protein [Variovorax sp.]
NGGLAVSFFCLPGRAWLSVSAAGITWPVWVDNTAAEHGRCEEYCDQLLHGCPFSLVKFEPT